MGIVSLSLRRYYLAVPEPETLQLAIIALSLLALDLQKYYDFAEAEGTSAQDVDARV